MRTTLTLDEALQIARSLDAEPLEQRVARRMRALGLPVPRGPHVTTRSNPGQLTDRQLEVLSLVGRGHSNAEIAHALRDSMMMLKRFTEDLKPDEYLHAEPFKVKMDVGGKPFNLTYEGFIAKLFLKYIARDLKTLF